MEPIKEPGDAPDRYCITELLAATHNSKIYHAFDRETHAQLAIKKCLVYDEFYREVAVSSNIFSRGHNNYIVPIIDCVIEQKYLIMPYMAGGNLWDLRKNKEGLSPEECFAVAAQVGLALQEIHASGVIHNDVKTGNILLADAEHFSERTSLVKLTDFGLSSGSYGEPGWRVGTTQYMAPEKFDPPCKPAPALDIYSLGLVVHEMLTDTLLYKDIDFYFPHMKIQKEIPPHEKIPEKCLKVIRTACELDPANRYKSAVEMTSDLEKAVYGC